MLGKYLKDLGIKEDNTPQGWNKDDSRQERWIKEREIYGFDEKEIWSMDFTFKLWLYERLSMYNEVKTIEEYLIMCDNNKEINISKSTFYLKVLLLGFS